VTEHIPGAADAARTTVAAWDATVWRRDPDGGWRIEVDISTRLPGG
jgi:ketosteroid isomerase-like protein